MVEDGLLSNPAGWPLNHQTIVGPSVAYATRLPSGDQTGLTAVPGPEPDWPREDVMLTTVGPLIPSVRARVGTRIPAVDWEVSLRSASSAAATTSAKELPIKSLFEWPFRQSASQAVVYAASRHAYRWCNPPSRGSEITLAFAAGLC